MLKVCNSSLYSENLLNSPSQSLIKLYKNRIQLMKILFAEIKQKMDLLLKICIALQMKSCQCISNPRMPIHL